MSKGLKRINKTKRKTQKHKKTKRRQSGGGNDAEIPERVENLSDVMPMIIKRTEDNGLRLNKSDYIKLSKFIHPDKIITSNDTLKNDAKALFQTIANLYDKDNTTGTQFANPMISISGTKISIESHENNATQSKPSSSPQMTPNRPSKHPWQQSNRFFHQPSNKTRDQHRRDQHRQDLDERFRLIKLRGKKRREKRQSSTSKKISDAILVKDPNFLSFLSGVELTEADQEFITVLNGFREQLRSIILNVHDGVPFGTNEIETKHMINSNLEILEILYPQAPAFDINSTNIPNTSDRYSTLDLCLGALIRNKWINRYNDTPIYAEDSQNDLDDCYLVIKQTLYAAFNNSTGGGRNKHSTRTKKYKRSFRKQNGTSTRKKRGTRKKLR